jgi:hypothetical protein
MTDQPSIQQQLSELIDYLVGPYLTASPDRLAAAIVAAVNDGTCDPIVPEGKVVVDAKSWRLRSDFNVEPTDD